MGFFDKVMKKPENVDIEEFLNNLDVEEEAMYEDADALVKPITLARDQDAQVVTAEIKQGNVILLNIADLSKRNPVKLKELVNVIKNEVNAVNGDMARISPERILVTPARVKIIKRKE